MLAKPTVYTNVRPPVVDTFWLPYPMVVMTVKKNQAVGKRIQNMREVSLAQGTQTASAFDLPPAATFSEQDMASSDEICSARTCAFVCSIREALTGKVKYCWKRACWSVDHVSQ
jgi:hypothetical protein